MRAFTLLAALQLAGSAAALLQAAPGRQLFARADALDLSKMPSMHTVFSAECTPYFDWQSLGLVRSHREVRVAARPPPRVIMLHGDWQDKSRNTANMPIPAGGDARAYHTPVGVRRS